MVCEGMIAPLPVGAEMFAEVFLPPIAYIHSAYSWEQSYRVVASPMYYPQVLQRAEAKGLDAARIEVIPWTSRTAVRTEESNDALTFLMGGSRMGIARVMAFQMQMLYELIYGVPLHYVAVNDVPPCFEIRYEAPELAEYLGAVEWALKQLPLEFRVLEHKSRQNPAVRVAIDTYALASLATTMPLHAPETFKQRVRQILESHGIPSNVTVRKNPGSVRVTVDRRYAQNFLAMSGMALQDSDGSLICVRDRALAPLLSQPASGRLPDYQRIACLSSSTVSIEPKHRRVNRV